MARILKSGSFVSQTFNYLKLWTGRYILPNAIQFISHNIMQLHSEKACSSLMLIYE